MFYKYNADGNLYMYCQWHLVVKLTLKTENAYFSSRLHGDVTKQTSPDRDHTISNHNAIKLETVLKHSLLCHQNLLKFILLFLILCVGLCVGMGS